MKSVLLVIGVLLASTPVFWTVQRILRPIDRAAKGRDAPLRFSLGDFLCLFWIVQLPLAFVFQIQGEETEPYYWALTAAVWIGAPLVWFTAARALSKAGITGVKHRVIFLGIVVPTVYYGLFPFIGLSMIGVAQVLSEGPGYLLQHRLGTLIWLVMFVILVAAGFYSPWLVRQAKQSSAGEV